MPQIYIKKNNGMIADENSFFHSLLTVLPTIVAEALTCTNPDGKLTVDDIAMDVSNFGKLDRHEKPIQIIIVANDYPERKADLYDRAVEIRNRIHKFCPELKDAFFVWVQLVEGAFIMG